MQSMKRSGTQRGRALLVDGEGGVRRTISRYLQLHGMDVVEIDGLGEAAGTLAGQPGFDLLVTELVTPRHSEWSEWQALLNRDARVAVLVYGNHSDDWNEVRGELGRPAGFIGKPFTLSDFHWALQHLL